MSFRSAWRHAAKTSPSTQHILPPKVDDDDMISGGTPEPTLVVTNSRPPSTHDTKTDKSVDGIKDAGAVQQMENAVPKPLDDTAKIDAGATQSAVEEEQQQKQVPTQESRWTLWWGKSKSEDPTAAKDPGDKVTINNEPTNNALGSTSTSEVTSTTPVEQPPTSAPSCPVDIAPPPKSAEPSSGSYLAWLWSSRSPPKSANPDLEKFAADAKIINEDIAQPSAAPERTNLPNSPDRMASTQNPLITTLPQTRSSWMTFWARSDSMPDLKRTVGPETMQVPGDIDSQGRPLKRQRTQDDTSIDIPATDVNASIKSKPPHTPTTSTSTLPATPSKGPDQPPTSTTPPKPESPSKATPSKASPSKATPTKKGKPAVPPPPNHVVPEFETVYPTLPAKEGFLYRVTKAILPGSGNPAHTILPGALHAHSRRCAPPPIRKAVAIGIHGFFPLRIIRSVLGEPTGTSVKFATLASEAIHRFSDKHYGCPREIEVVKIALEGEGTVAARIDLLWRKLVSETLWMEFIREADLILVACHSQGSPVGAGVMARLVEEGIVSHRTRLGLLCVAGIHLGPAIDVGQRVVIKAYNAIESEAARELYDFQDSDSKVSRKYVEALRTILAHDTRLTFIGSIDDHLVPMYSSTFSNAYHGAIYRAVFVDGRIHTNDFLARLVAFALRLRNEGWRDHGVMNELSSSLMGNFYTGEGHSRIYDEPAVYDLALRNTLETTSMKDMPLHVEPFKARTTPNPYLLPWSMRGVFEETVRGPLSHELEFLKEEFAKWEPKGPKLKDLKWRMEGWNTVKPKI